MVLMSSGSADSDAAVNPTKSQKSAVTTFRSSATGRVAPAGNGAAHSPQNLLESGFWWPHAEQSMIGRVYGLRGGGSPQSHPDPPRSNDDRCRAFIRSDVKPLVGSMGVTQVSPRPTENHRSGRSLQL